MQEIRDFQFVIFRFAIPGATDLPDHQVENDSHPATAEMRDAAYFALRFRPYVPSSGESDDDDQSGIVWKSPVSEHKRIGTLVPKLTALI